MRFVCPTDFHHRQSSLRCSSKHSLNISSSQISHCTIAIGHSASWIRCFPLSISALQSLHLITTYTHSNMCTSSHSSHEPLHVQFPVTHEYRPFPLLRTPSIFRSFCDFNLSRDLDRDRDRDRDRELNLRLRPFRLLNSPDPPFSASLLLNASSPSSSPDAFGSRFSLDALDDEV